MSFWPNEGSPKREEHRGGPDLLVKLVRLSSVVCWFLYFAVLLIWDSARPQFYTILDMHYNKTSRLLWREDLIFLAFIFVIITFIFTIIALLFNTRRLKRTYDKISISLVLCLGVSGITMLVFLIYYIVLAN